MLIDEIALMILKKLLIFYHFPQVFFSFSLINSFFIFFIGHQYLFLGYMGLCCLSYWKEESVKKVVGLLFLLAISFKFRSDYGFRGFAFILMLYALRDSLLLKSVIGCCMLPGAWMPGLAFIPIALYNGQRGFIQGSFGKYCFYAFYPLHLLILYFYRVVGGV